MPETLRVLILEDNPADADLVQFELEEAELTFTAKVSGRADAGRQGVLIRDAAGRPFRSFTAIRDITERKRAEEDTKTTVRSAIQ